MIIALWGNHINFCRILCFLSHKIFYLLGLIFISLCGYYILSLSSPSLSSPSLSLSSPSLSLSSKLLTFMHVHCLHICYWLILKAMNLTLVLGILIVNSIGTNYMWKFEYMKHGWFILAIVTATVQCASFLLLLFWYFHCKMNNSSYSHILKTKLKLWFVMFTAFRLIGWLVGR